MKIALFSTWNDKYGPLAEIAIPNWVAYCKRHGYTFVPFEGEYHEDPNMPLTFGDKVKFELWYCLRGKYDVAMFLDIDSLIMTHDVCIEDVLGHRRFLWTFDDNGPLSGLWIARTDDVTEKHLRYAYERAAIENNVRHGKIEPNGISDQDSMTRLMNTPPFSDTFGNCFRNTDVGFCHPDTWTPGKWIVTCRGGSLESKLATMKK